MVSIVTMASSILQLLVEVKILFVKPSPFPCLDWDSLVCGGATCSSKRRV